MFSKMWQWLNERWPLTAVFRWGLKEDIPGGSSYVYVLGSTTLIIFLLQTITGVWQLFYYVPSIEYAYNSINYLRIEVPFGWLIHGMHYWGAQIMVVLVGLHLLRTFIWKAYEEPRQLTWLIGVVLLLLTVGMSFTGAPLPWDERGYWAAEVGTSISGTVPIIGDFLKRLLRGGEGMGQLTLSRFFILHVAILPGLLLVMLVMHIVAFRQFGSIGPWNMEKAKKSGFFWPDQVFKDVIAMILLIILLFFQSTFYSPTFMGQADPLDNTYSPKPEWNFLFLYQALKAFKGSWEPVGTVGIPIVIVLIFLFIPFIDKRKERNPVKRPFAISSFLLAVAGLLFLTFTGKYAQPNLSQKLSPLEPVVQIIKSVASDSSQGFALFQSKGCLVCHAIDGQGGNIGPDLSQERSKGRTEEWIITQILDPKKHDPNTVMPAFSTLKQQQLNALADYLLSLNRNSSTSLTQPDSTQKLDMSQTAGNINRSSPIKVNQSKIAGNIPSAANKSVNFSHLGLAANIIGNVKHGNSLFAQYCQSCHGEGGTDKIPNPGSASGTVPPLNHINRELYNHNAIIFTNNIDHFIQHGAIPPGPNPTLQMPNFGDSYDLTQQEISNIEAYILHLNGVNRAQLQHPGLHPQQFFVLTMGVLGLVGIVLSIVWFWPSVKTKKQR